MLCLLALIVKIGMIMHVNIDLYVLRQDGDPNKKQPNFFLGFSQGPRGYKGITGPVGIPGPPVSTKTHTHTRTQTEYRCSVQLLCVSCRVRRDLRGPLERLV